MTWSCVLCGSRAFAEVEAGVAVAMCAEHHATFERNGSWCGVPECTVPTRGEFCEAHRRVVAGV